MAVTILDPGPPDDITPGPKASPPAPPNALGAVGSVPLAPSWLIAPNSLANPLPSPTDVNPISTGAPTANVPAPVANVIGGPNPVALARAPAPSSADLPTDQGVMERMWQVESGNQQFDKNGKTIVSPAGAVGIAQVMPSTGPEAARLAGLPWDEARLRSDPDYNKALGTAYYQAQLKKYGDPAKAAAAYNAGPGAVDSALAKAKVSGQQWTNFLPAETQNYVSLVTGHGPVGTQVAKGGGENSPQGQISQNSSGTPQGGQDLSGLFKLALLQAAFPQHQFQPIQYDPFKVMEQERVG